MPDRNLSQIEDGSESPRNLDGVERFHRDLARVQREDLPELARDRRERRQRLEKGVLHARYEDCGIAIRLVYAIRDDRQVRDRFADAFEQEFGREFKEGKLEREAFLFLYGEKRKDSAGTDAIALHEAIQRKIRPERIPEYIKVKGGLETLLKAERQRRDPLVEVSIRIRRAALKRLEELELGGRAQAVVMKSWNEHAPVKYAITAAKT